MKNTCTKVRWFILKAVRRPLGLIGRSEDAGPLEYKGPNKDKNKDQPKDKKPHPEKGNPNNRL